MDNFKIIYKILHYLEKCMDMDKPDFDDISAERLRISETRLMNIMQLLIEAGYIAGIRIIHTKRSIGMQFIQPRITLAGLEYLQKDNIVYRD